MAIALGMVVFREKLDRRGWLALLVAPRRADQGHSAGRDALSGLLIGASCMFMRWCVNRLILMLPVWLNIDDRPGNAGLSGLSDFVTKSGRGFSWMAVLWHHNGAGIRDCDPVPLVLFHVGNRYLHLNITVFYFILIPACN